MSGVPTPENPGVAHCPPTEHRAEGAADYPPSQTFAGSAATQACSEVSTITCPKTAGWLPHRVAAGCKVEERSKHSLFEPGLQNTKKEAPKRFT